MMKSHKRNKTPQAYTHGFVCGIKGYSLEVCPYVSTLTLRSAWLNGWREGRMQMFGGFTGINKQQIH